MNTSFLNQTSKIKPLFEYLNKQQENRKFIKSVEISATFFLITFFLYFAIRPTFLTISKLNGDIQSKKILQTELKNKINNVIQAQDLFSQVQEKYLVVNSSLPDRPFYSQSASQIQKTGQDTGIPVEGLSFDLNPSVDDKTNNNPNIKSYLISLRIPGQFNNAVNLATKLLSNRRVVNIDTLYFDINTDTNVATPSASGQLNTRFSSTFYYWPTSDAKK